MIKKYKKSLFIFRRDLRVDDNTGLITALQQSERVITCFIFDPNQVGKGNNYKSNNAIQFMLASLHDLNQQLHKRGGKLFFFHDDPSNVIQSVIKYEKIDAVFVNTDYTPYSVKRDAALAKTCKKNNIDLCIFSDLVLNVPEHALKKDGKPYTIFTAFFKRSLKNRVAEQVTCHNKNYYTKAVKGSAPEGIFKKILTTNNKKIFAHGGRTQALKILHHLEQFKHYIKERDIPSLEATTGLAAHLKFGTCSVREAYHAIKKTLGPHHPLIRQLYWRDFFTHIAFHFPHVFGHPFHRKYDKLKWDNKKSHFSAWCLGKTGFPLIDAGMRQLNTTGFMHNRVRMAVASFLTKDLHIDWRWGERYFAQQLVDYDPAVNNGNWQWAASTGCDAQPYFRIFNPWLQQKKFDPQAAYIKKWVPELDNLPAKQIHQWFKYCTTQPIKNYPSPLVDHAVESKKAKMAYKKAPDSK